MLEDDEVLGEAEMAGEASKIEIRIDKEKIKDDITVDEFIAMQEGSMKATRTILGRFVWKDGAYLPLEEGEKIIGSKTFREMEELVQTFRQGVMTSVVPPMSGEASI